jgi:hypothetical protein
MDATMNKKITVEQLTIYILLGSGIILSLIQFLYNRSIWIDEAMLTLNITHRVYYELLKPLASNQVAPVLFLMIEKFFSTLIPNSEYGLRLFPLLSYWVSLFFFYKIVKILFNNKFTTIFALSLFVLNYFLIYYSSEVKQYMSDVLTYTVVVYFILKDYKKEQNKLYILGITGIIAVFLSNVTPIILSVAGLYLLYEQFYLKKTRNIAGLAIVFAIWLSVFGVYYYFFIANHPSREFMTGFWEFVHGFLPLNSLSGIAWFLAAKAWWVSNMFSPRIPWIVIIAILFIFGTVSMIREKKIGLIILTFSSPIIHILLSSLHLYPFEQRLVLYILPGLILICTAGFTYIIALLSQRFKSLNLKLFCLVPLIFVFSFNEFPVKQMPVLFEVKKDIIFLKENAKEGETIYVYWLGGPSFQYYQDTGFANFKIPVIIDKNLQVFGRVKHQSELLKMLENIHGKCWLYFVYDPNWEGDKEYIVNQLDSMGYKRIKEHITTSSSIYLYDFK